MCRGSGVVYPDLTAPSPDTIELKFRDQVVPMDQETYDRVQRLREVIPHFRYEA